MKIPFENKILAFDKKKFDFDLILKDLFEVKELEKLHLKHASDNGIKPISKDTHTFAHKAFYNKINNGWPYFENLYKKFVNEFVLNALGKERVYYQTFPNFRISFPGNVAVSTWHKDSDSENLHPRGEINFFLPVTKSFDTNTIWIESKPDKNDFKPINMKFGEIFIFNGGECTHGNKTNNTGSTRISFDFRIMPLENYNPEYKGRTRTKNLEFKPGQYYSDTSHE